jgi:hypothetical protein
VKLDTAYATALMPVPEGAARSAGVAIGERAAAAAIADRADDATNAPDTYRPVKTPGVWIPTVAPVFAEYARAKPWVFSRADQFRPGPPPALISAAYAREYNETKELGGAKSVRRTLQQTDAVKFWSQPNLLTAATPCNEGDQRRIRQHEGPNALRDRRDLQVQVAVLVPGRARAGAANRAVDSRPAAP